MKRKILSVFVACIALSFAFVLSALAVDVYIDGTKVEYSDDMGYPYINWQGRTLVPLRATMEAFGANVDWDAESNVAIITLNETTVCCPVGERNIYRNGTKIPNDIGAVIVDGRTYLPIRAVLEAFDATVGYDGNVIVTRPEAQRIAKIIESAPAGDSNFWNKWANALSLKNSGKYAEAIEAFKPLIPTLIAYDKDKNINCAMAYNHLGYCYSMIGMTDYAVTCYNREGDYWELAGDHESSVAAYRKAKYSRTTVQLFATAFDEKYDFTPLYPHRYAPKNGVLLGVTLKHSSYDYLNSFEQLTGKKIGAGLIYGTLSDAEQAYSEVFKKAAENNVVIQYALQPKNLYELSGIVENDERIIKIAKAINKSEARVLIRFAAEMNETNSSIFTKDYELYKQKFRYVADIFHTYAPSCAMVWSPNFSPEDTIHLYYPGDKYVDIVGISVYSEYQPETDPLGLGVDRSRSAALLNKIVSLYGYKKPIMVSECGASYRHATTGKDITEFASKQINEFFTYLPIKFPQVCSAFLFETYDVNGTRLFEFSGNPAYQNAFISAMQSDSYISSISETSSRYSFELGNNVRVPASSVELHSFVDTLMGDFSYIVYRVNGVDIGTAYGIPYTVSYDFAPYKGQTVALSCLAFDSQQKLCATRTINIVVE